MKNKLEKLKDAYCRGCTSYYGIDRINKVCDMLPINENEKCPCVDCLIKSMCDDGCKLFAKYCGISEEYL